MGEECAKALTDLPEEAEKEVDSEARIMALVDWLFMGDEGPKGLPS